MGVSERSRRWLDDLARLQGRFIRHRCGGIRYAAAYPRHCEQREATRSPHKPALSRRAAIRLLARRHSPCRCQKLGGPTRIRSNFLKIDSSRAAQRKFIVKAVAVGAGYG